MTDAPTVEFDFHIQKARHGRKVVREGAAKPAVPATPQVARLMALAIEMERMVRTGEVASYAELARLGHVSRARVTQVVDLINLAPDLQERLLFLRSGADGRRAITERAVRAILRSPDWSEQRRAWAALTRHESPGRA